MNDNRFTPNLDNGEWEGTPHHFGLIKVEGTLSGTYIVNYYFEVLAQDFGWEFTEAAQTAGW